ncbi:MAG: hypothetical protein ACJ74Y_09405 [Bryobacteraceae bacterium]
MNITVDVTSRGSPKPLKSRMGACLRRACDTLFGSFAGRKYLALRNMARSIPARRKGPITSQKFLARMLAPLRDSVPDFVFSGSSLTKIAKTRTCRLLVASCQRYQDVWTDVNGRGLFPAQVTTDGMIGYGRSAELRFRGISAMAGEWIS